jgi:aspartate/methionine/tyrosine aminotransferase
MLSFNQGLQNIQPSASMKLGLSAIDPDLLNLSIGIPDLPPPAEVGAMIGEFVRRNQFPYVPSRGSLKARKNLSALLFSEEERPDPETEISLTAGAKFGIYLSLKTCTSFGDDVVIMEPYWLSYPPMAYSLGLSIFWWKPGLSDDGTLSFDLAWLEDHCKRNRPKALIFNNPNNPSGLVFSPDFISELSRITLENDCWMIVDEVYKHHTFSGVLPTFPKAKNIVRIGSLSKSVSLPGLRLGYIAAPKAMLEKADLLTQHLLTCANAISNFVAEELQESVFESYRQLSIQTYRSRYQDFINLFSNQFHILKSEASFYALVKPKANFEGEVSEYLKKEYRILTTPGAAYGEWFSDYARICLTVDSQVLKDRFLTV